jgi:DNA polymerase
MNSSFETYYKLQVDSFNEWRVQARRLLEQNIEPKRIIWGEVNDQQLKLEHFFKQELTLNTNLNSEVTNAITFNVPKSFIKLATKVSYHRDTQKWHYLYTLLWRIKHEGAQVLNYHHNDLIAKLSLMNKDISRDSHKMKAFVRFKAFKDLKFQEIELDDLENTAMADQNTSIINNVSLDEPTAQAPAIKSDSETIYIAWYQPDHFTLELVANFFTNRFRAMRWIIYTPDKSLYWDGQQATYGPGLAKDPGLIDETDQLWLTFYSSIFNPARLKIKAMKKEMPVRFWHTLPEARLIPQLIREAPLRVEKMIKDAQGS